jgi:hypothetical protein
MVDVDDAKFKAPEKIIKVVNNKKAVNKIIRLYIDKILFNQN